MGRHGAQQDNTEFWIELAIFAVVVVVFLAMLPGWLRGDQERAVLNAAGYTNVQLDGFRWFDCPDLFGMGFKATGPGGAPAQGAVCRGILTKASIRLQAPASAPAPAR